VAAVGLCPLPLSPLDASGLFWRSGDPAGGGCVMAYKRRSKMKSRKSKRLFTATASGTHPKNNSGAPMRGGIRL